MILVTPSCLTFMNNEISLLKPQVSFNVPIPNDVTVSFENAAEKYLVTLGSKASVITVRAKLNRIAKWYDYRDYRTCDWHLMRYANVIAFVDNLRKGAEPLAVTTINAYLCAIKGVAQMAWNLGQISDHDLMRIKSIKQLRGYRKTAGRALSFQESEKLLSTCDDNSPRPIRDKAILFLLLGCGLRRAEITVIEMRNVFLEEARIRLIGKGNKERDVFLNDEVCEAVQQWVQTRSNFIKVDPYQGFLFGKWTRGCRNLIVDRPLNPWAIGEIVNTYKIKAGDSTGRLKTITTHDLRRTFTTRLLEQGVDIVVVRDLMGHSNISTTSIYDRRGEAAMKKAILQTDLLHRK